MSKKVSDARDAVEIARDYAKHSMNVVYWKDVVSCELDEKTGDWKVTFEASPGLLSPYFKYEIILDSTGNVKKARKID